MSLNCSKLEDKLNSIYLPWKLAEFLSCPRKLLYWRHFLNVKHFADWIEPNSDMITIPFWKIWNWNNAWIERYGSCLSCIFYSFFISHIWIFRRHKISQHFSRLFPLFLVPVSMNFLYISKLHIVTKITFASELLFLYVIYFIVMYCSDVTTVFYATEITFTKRTYEFQSGLLLPCRSQI